MSEVTPADFDLHFKNLQPYLPEKKPAKQEYVPIKEEDASSIYNRRVSEL